MPADLTPLAALVAERDRLADQVKEDAERLAALDDQIKEKMGDEEVALVAGRPAFTWKRGETWRLDETLLKSRYPDIKRECTTRRETRTFRRVQADAAQTATAAVVNAAVDVGPDSIVSKGAGF